MTDSATEIEKHYVGNHGPLLTFVEQSATYRDYGVTDSEIIVHLQKAGRIEDKDARELALELIAKIESLNATGDELRKRFTITLSALNAINDTLNKSAEKDAL